DDLAVCTKKIDQLLIVSAVGQVPYIDAGGHSGSFVPIPLSMGAEGLSGLMRRHQCAGLLLKLYRSSRGVALRDAQASSTEGVVPGQGHQSRRMRDSLRVQHTT